MAIPSTTTNAKMPTLPQLEDEKKNEAQRSCWVNPGWSVRRGEATNDVMKEVLEKAGGLEENPERERRGRSKSRARESTVGGGGVGGDYIRAAGPQRMLWLELLL